jgi:hypothetical protein
MLKKLIPLGLSFVLLGCGSSSDDSSSSETVTPIAASSSTIGFYLASWQSPAGTIITKNAAGEIVESVDVDDINTYSLSADSLNYLFFEFLPSDSIVTCPRFDGCGRVERGNVNDINDNSVIDYQEATSVNLSFQAQAFVAPGVNEIFFSPMSTLVSDNNYSAHLASISATAFNHLTHSDISDTLEREITANAYTYAAIVAASLDNTFILDDAFEKLINNNDDLDSWLLFNQYASQYLSNNLFSEEGNALIQGVVGQVQQTIASISTYSNWLTIDYSSQELESRELLVDTRNVLALARLQESMFADELDTNLEELENAFDDTSQETLTVLTKVVNIILTEYSPLSDNPPTTGTYTLEDLTIEFSSSPYTWAISGTFDDLPLNIDLSIPTFRISGVLGNRIEGVMAATVVNGDTILTVDVKEVVLQFDGTTEDDTDSEVETGIAELATEILIEKPSGSLLGNIAASFDRSVTNFGTESTTLSSLDFSGQYISSSQTTSFHITGIEATPFIGEDNDDLVFSIELDMPISGTSEFVLGYVGDIDQLSELTSGDLYININKRGLDLTVREVNDNISLVVTGQYGRWLDVKQSGKNYSGGLYFGDTKIGTVTAVRGIPGVQFDNGEFESLF